MDRNGWSNEPSALIGEECEAFLNGRWVEHLLRLGKPVPRWAWINKVAHADGVELHDLSDDLTAAVHSGDEFRWAAAFLAAEMIDLAAGRAALIEDMQQQVLVEVELELLGGGQTPGLSTGHLLAECGRRLGAEMRRLNSL